MNSLRHIIILSFALGAVANGWVLVPEQCPLLPSPGREFATSHPPFKINELYCIPLEFPVSLEDPGGISPIQIKEGVVCGFALLLDTYTTKQLYIPLDIFPRFSM